MVAAWVYALLSEQSISELETPALEAATPADVLKADLIHGARLLDWEGQIGALKPGYFADVIAVTGNPLENISAVKSVSFVMKNGVVYKK